MSLRIKLFCQSIVSDWNHGNAHFLRGILSEFAARGFTVESLEPEDSWSRKNLIHKYGAEPVNEFERRFPTIAWSTYDLKHDRVENLIADANIVIVHEWNTPELVAAIGEYRARHKGVRIFFHDTHHRAITAPGELALDHLRHYDGVLVYGKTLQDAYARLGWRRNVHVWHEAADTRVFKPVTPVEPPSGLIWIGNWGDDERSAEIGEFLIGPASTLGLAGTVHGVRYPSVALKALADAGLHYEGWIANAEVPKAFARHRVTMHIPRRPYRESLPGIPTIRMFEALACGIPLVSAPWSDVEGLFRPGVDFLFARDGAEMRDHLRDVLHDAGLAQALASSGSETIRARHTCRHRADELFGILAACGNGHAAENLPAREAAA
jgi:spore maturation protein CgeB